MIGGRFYPVENQAPTDHAFLMGDELGVLAATVGPIQAILHSHTHKAPPDDPYCRVEWPSHADMRNWIAEWNPIPWGIAACDGEGISRILWLDDSNRPPLGNRQFDHGVTDCYSLVRDYFHFEKGIDIPNYPRGWEWWKEGKNHYLENFQAAGFVEIPRKEAVKGDCLIYKIRSQNPNHASVLVSDSMVLHHMFNRNSDYAYRREWARFEHMAVRYVGS